MRYYWNENVYSYNEIRCDLPYYQRKVYLERRTFDNDDIEYSPKLVIYGKGESHDYYIEKEFGIKYYLSFGINWKFYSLDTMEDAENLCIKAFGKIPCENFIQKDNQGLYTFRIHL